jgi:predicted  nucleic acid-binding Zn-ribbon protein
MTRSSRIALFVLGLAAVPLALEAQQRPAAPQPAAPQQAQPSPQQQQQMQAWYTELQQIGQRVSSVQAKALEDPALGARQKALGAEIEAAVLRIDPTLSGLPQRVQQLDAQLRDAYTKRDQARFQQLAAEGQQLEARFIRARGQALAQPELANRMKAFEGDLERRMAQIEPELPRLVERGRDLQSRLQNAMRAANP